jgi:flagellin-like hook-associated protein FlgL
MNGIDLLSQLQTDTAALRLKLQTLTSQSASGKVVTGSGDGAIAAQLPRVQNLSSQINRLGAYDGVVDQASGQAQATQGVLAQLSAIASQFSDTVAMQLDPKNPEAVTFAASAAKAALVQVGQLLDSQYNGQYLFGGTDYRNPPIPDPNGLPTSAMASAIAFAIGTLGGGNAAAVGAATKTAAQDDSVGVTPFSGFLASGGSGLIEPRRSVPAADGQTIAYGLFANRNAAATSSGETTGSWARDLMRGLASIAALTPAQASQTADFNSLATIIRDGLKSARNGLADESGALGLTQTRLSTTKTQNSLLLDALRSQLSNITDVDMASTLTNLQQTQTTLQASYTAISRLGSLTLSAYLR